MVCNRSSRRILFRGICVALFATSSVSLAMEEVELLCDHIGNAPHVYPSFDEGKRTFELDGVSFQNCSFSEVRIHCKVDRDGILEIKLNRMSGVLSITKPRPPRDDGRRHRLASPSYPNMDHYQCKHRPKAMF